jgi:hypothetical protein
MAGYYGRGHGTRQEIQAEPSPATSADVAWAGSAAAITALITATPDAARLEAEPGLGRTDAAQRDHRNDRLGGAIRQLVERQGQCSGLARRGEDGAEGDVIGALLLGARDIVDVMRRKGRSERRRPKSAAPARASPCRADAIPRSGLASGLDVLMHGDGGVPLSPERDEAAQQGKPLGMRQILLAQTEPAATALENGLRHVFERQPGLLAGR